MALDATILRDLIVQKIKDELGTGAETDQVKKVWLGVAEAIISHFKTYAVVIQDPDNHGDTEQNGTII